jgi:ACT domain
VDTAPPEELHVLVRVWLPDRPGALGLVASRIGSVGADIVGVDVVERGDRVAVDEFAVVVPDDGRLDLLVREIEQVDGASVEEVRRVGIFPDPRLDALESAAVLCETDSIDDLHQVLTAHVGREFLADWVALLRGHEILATDGDGVPDVGKLMALETGTAASPLVADGRSGPEDLAVARLPAHDASILVGRDGHVFRRRERAQLIMLARVADRAWTLLDA